MRYRVLTIGREYQCGSGAIARQLGERLGWKVFDGELMDEIVRLTHAAPDACRRTDERVDGWLHRMGKGLWSAAGEKGPAVIPLEELDADRMAELTRGVIEQLAEAGQCVIVGRGGNYILRSRADAFHLFLYAAPGWRAKRRQSQGVSRAEAEAEIARRDHERAAYIRRYFDEGWPKRQYCHLMLDAALGPEAVVAATLAAMQAPPPSGV